MATALISSNLNNADVISFVYPQLITFSSAGDNTAIAAVAGKQILVYRILLSFADFTNIVFKDGTNTNLSGTIFMSPNGAINLDSSNVPWYQTSKGKAFVINSSQPVSFGGNIWYQLV